ncbi:MAG: M23 family metallopeptidase, partial [Candidatus Poribacteria bacterium]|nr:M23 family metallopeptidase [Candidatus Poribacteria bacterium]
YATVYTHLSETLVTIGSSVKTGQIIGKVGETGSLIGASLYFELWHNYERLNTKEWLTKTP